MHKFKKVVFSTGYTLKSWSTYQHWL